MIRHSDSEILGIVGMAVTVNDNQLLLKQLQV